MGIVILAGPDTYAFAQKRTSPASGGAQVAVVADDPVHDVDGFLIKRLTAAKLSVWACDVAEQLVYEGILVRPQPVHGAARHSRHLDQFFKAEHLQADV